jgi:hypothetical protein
MQKLGRIALLGYNSGMNTTLIRVDPDRHMDRRYSVYVQPTLLDAVAVVCVLGSRRSSYQRMQVHGGCLTYVSPTANFSHVFA